MLPSRGISGTGCAVSRNEASFSVLYDLLPHRPQLATGLLCGTVLLSGNRFGAQVEFARQH